MLRNCFIPRQWRLPRVVWILMILELPFTVANLAIFGVASPNLYRTILWAYGGDRGWNSDPSTVLYAAANYKPVKTPIVWSSYNTQYNLYIGVICLFFYLLKVTGWLLHVCFPIISLPLHIALAALWANSIYVQTAPDTIDPTRSNHGAPWYITKNCNIVDDKNIRGYCMQAKSAFAISICMLVIYSAHILFAAYSLYPTREARLAHDTKVAEKKAQKEKWASSPYDNEMTAEEQWQHMWELQQLPRTPGTATGPGWGGKTPMTPRSRAFGELEGGGGGAGGMGMSQDAYYQQQQQLQLHQQQQQQMLLLHQQQQQQQQQQYETQNGQGNGHVEAQYYAHENGNGYAHAQSPVGYAPPGYVQHHSPEQRHSEYNYDGKGQGTAM